MLWDTSVCRFFFFFLIEDIHKNFLRVLFEGSTIDILICVVFVLPSC